MQRLKRAVYMLWLITLTVGMALAETGDQPSLTTTRWSNGKVQPVRPGRFDLSSAERPQTYTIEQLDWLEPSGRQLPQRAYAHTDFTAYTLEWGEAELGLTSVGVGILPGLQVSTSAPLDALGVFNGSAKLHFARLGPIDLAVQGSYATFNQPEIVGSYTSAASVVSARLLSPWSVHLTTQYTSVGAHGLPNTATIAPIVGSLTGFDLNAWHTSAQNADFNIAINAEVVRIQLASDIRFNRRDSLIFQAENFIWGSIKTDTSGDFAVPDVMGLDEALSMDVTGPLSPAQFYAASIAWQWDWNRSHLRLGLGVSSTPGAWAFQSTEYAVRFGGKSRRYERQLRTAWRKNRRNIRQGGDTEPVASMRH